MTRITKKGLGGLWESQYAPREKILLQRVSPDVAKRWKTQTISKKMTVINNMHRRGLL